jgi:nitrogen regulatory protein PII
MKLVWVVADAARLEAVKHTLAAAGAAGWTVMAVEEGAGRTGVHAGDRVHPGALISVVVVADDALAPRLFEAVTTDRDAVGDRVTRVFQLPVERLA